MSNQTPRPVEEIAAEIVNQWPIGKSVIHGLIRSALQTERDRAEKAEYQLQCFEEHDGPSCLLKERADQFERERDEALRLLEPFALTADWFPAEIEDEVFVRSYSAVTKKTVKLTLGHCRAARDFYEKKREESTPAIRDSALEPSPSPSTLT